MPRVRKALPCSAAEMLARDTAEMYEKYLAGLTQEEVGELYGLTASGVSARFRRAGLARRRGGNPPVTPESVERARRLYVDEKLTYHAGAAEMGISVGAFRTRLRKAGVKRRRTTDRVCWMCGRTKHLDQFRFEGRRWRRDCRKCQAAAEGAA